MGAKSCCGSSPVVVVSGGGGGTGEPLTTGDTPTVNLEGAGTAASPLTANAILSADAGNALVPGTDGGLFVAPSSGGGLTTVATTDSATVDFSGDGTPGTPITAVVTPSADAGNTLVAGSDGKLYVPTTVAPAPVWNESGQIDLNGDTGTHAVNAVHLIPGAEFTVPEDGLYLVTMTVRASLQETGQTTGTHGLSFTAILQHNGATVVPAVLAADLDATVSPSALQMAAGGTAALTKRVELIAGDVIRVAFVWQSGPVSTPVPASFSTATTLGYHKII